MEHTLAQAVSTTEATLREHAERLSQESKDHVTAQHADLTSMLVDLQHTVTKLQENQLAHNAAQIQHWRQYASRDQEVQNLQLQLMNARNHAHRVQAFAISRVHGMPFEDALVGANAPAEFDAWEFGQWFIPIRFFTYHTGNGS